MRNKIVIVYIVLVVASFALGIASGHSYTVYGHSTYDPPAQPGEITRMYEWSGWFNMSFSRKTTAKYANAPDKVIAKKTYDMALFRR